jgi:hypothetical protein
MYDVAPRLHTRVGRSRWPASASPAAMNAPNPLMPEPRPLSESTLEQLRRALQERRRSPAAGEAALQTALQTVATEARERSLRPEELIVALKHVLDESPGNRAASGEDRRLREWIVTTCIRAYFEEGESTQ